MAQVELLLAGAALMLLGATVSLCIKCQLFAAKREKQLGEQRSQLESQRSFEVIRSQSTATRRLEQTTRRLEQTKEAGNYAIARKNETLSAPHHAEYGSRTEFRYQNFLTEDCLQGDAAYVEPISLDYYNCASFFTPPKEKEEDSHSYQNVIIGESPGSNPDDAVDYENSAAIHMWKLQHSKALRAESPDDEPDYVNTAPAPLAKQSILHKF